MAAIPNNTFKVGFLFFVALVVLGAATVSVGHLDFLHKGHDLQVKFTNIGGLKDGDPVRVAGLELGRVKKLDLLPDGVLVTLRMTQALDLHEGYTAQIMMSSLVGGRHIAIEQGDPLKPVISPSTVLVGTPATSAMDEIGDLVRENRQSVKDFIANLNNMSDSLKRGEGTLGRLLKDEKLYDDARAMLVEAREGIAEIKKAGGIIDQVKEQLDKNEGTLVKLLKDNEVYDNLKDTTEKLRVIVDRAEKGEGTIGQLLTDKEMYNEAKALLAEMRSTVTRVQDVVAKIDDGKGPMGKLINDEDMARRLDETITEVKALATSMKNIAQKIDRGEGTIGKLANETTLYDKALVTVDSANEALEALDSTLGKASRVKTYVTFGTRYYGRTALIAPYASIRVYPGPDRYVEAGAVVWPATEDTPWDFEKKTEDGRGDTFIKPTALLGWTFMDNRLDLAGGLLEGKFGGRASYRFTLPDIEHDITLAAEVRGGWDDEDELDERAGTIMARIYLDTKVWKWIHVHAGVSRFHKGTEVFGGISFTYEDEDIRTFVSLLGLSK